MKKRQVLLVLFIAVSFVFSQNKVPEDFVYLKDIIPDIQIELRYYSSNNFIGRPVDGYEANVCILSKEATLALSKVQDELRPFGLGLKVFDAYRPQRAVNHFVRWAKNLDDTKMKSQYYPREAKKTLFKHGYIASRSGHSRGSTIDLTIVSLSGKALDMGSPFDFFGPESWLNNTNLSLEQLSNRLLLRTLMMKHGFKPYSKEWWHFTLKDEPFPKTYFDFIVQ